MKNFHLPLPDQTWSALEAEADKAGMPATKLAREAITWWLEYRRKVSRHAAIAAYASAAAGSDLDLDSPLESAAIQELLESEAQAK